MPQKHKVVLIGSGNWGSTVGKILAENTREHPGVFEQDVTMWVFEEDVDVPDHGTLRDQLGDKPVKITHAINTTHQNFKYLPGITLPDNLIANSDIQDTVRGASILVFNLPHQFISRILDQINGHHLPYARAISCIKGVDVSDGTVTLYSELIMEKLGIYCGSLSGANIASEVAAETLCETTVGYDGPPMDYKQLDGSSTDNLIKVDEQRQIKSKPSHIKLHPVPQSYSHVDSRLLNLLFGRPYLYVHVVRDVAGVALAGALKNIVALAVGFVTGKGWGENTKAAVMRIGILEMVEFGRLWFPQSVNERTFTEESAGVADLITSASAGRNSRSACHAVQKHATVDEIERTELGGQKLQGTSTARAVCAFLGEQGKLEQFPLFTFVYNILEGHMTIEALPDLLRTRTKTEA